MDLKFLKGKESISRSSREILGKARCQFCLMHWTVGSVRLAIGCFSQKLLTLSTIKYMLWAEVEAEVKQVSTLNFVCHMCGRLCKSNASQKSRLRAHRHSLGITDNSPTNWGEEHWDGCCLLRWSNCHISQPIGIIVRVFVNGLETRIQSQVESYQRLKMVLDISLIYTQHYKV